MKRKLAVLFSLLLLGSFAAQSTTAAPNLTAWQAQASTTPGNVVADSTGWTFDGTTNTAVIGYNYGALDDLDGKPVDGSTVEYVVDITDAGLSIALGSMYKDGTNNLIVLKLEQYLNTGKFGITEPGVADHTLSTPSPFGQQTHVVFVRNSNSTIDLYVNGAYAETTVTSNFFMSGGVGNLGANQNGKDNPSGDIYGVATYDVALNATQIADLFATLPAVGQFPPEWQEDPIDGGEVLVGEAYAGSLAGKATDPNGDEITYAKVSGPSWLNVETNGILSGTPLIGDLGTNDFVVSATDLDGSATSTNADLQIVVTEDPAIWTGTGGDGQWYTAANWSGNAVPAIDGADNPSIAGADVTYTAGGDMNWNYGSSLLLDGASLTQTTTHWTRYERGSTFTLLNGSHLDFSSARFEIRMRGTGAQTFAIDASTWSGKELLADDHITFALSNGATVNLTGGLTTLQNGSLFDVTDSTMNLRGVQFLAYGGNSTFINVNDGAQVNLLNPDFSGTNVVTKAGGSMINFALDSTGTVFIDNLTQAELEAMIGQEKFGVDGTIDTTVASYTIVPSGAGQLLSLIPPPPEEIGTITIDTIPSGVTITWDSAAGQNYDVQYKTNLITQATWITETSEIGVGGSMTVTSSVSSAEAFYQVVTP